jgi:hypothetical protein
MILLRLFAFSRQLTHMLAPHTHDAQTPLGQSVPCGCGSEILTRHWAEKPVYRLDRVSLDTLLLILGGFSNDYSRPRTERWSAEEDARLIAYYRAHSPNGRLAYEAMMELKLKFRNRSKPALYGRICELRKAGRLDPPTGYSHGSTVVAIFRPANHDAILASTLSGGAP